MLRWTLLTSAVASASFVGTLAFAPAVVSVGERLALGQAQVQRIRAAEATAESPACRSPFAKIVAALRHIECR